MVDHNTALARIIAATMRPFVKLLLRYGISYSDLCTILRRVYVEVAAGNFVIPGRKQTHARIAVLTGISRHEIKKLLQQSSRNEPGQVKLNKAGWALSGWSRDSDYVDEHGQPKSLPITADDGVSFQSLVKKNCGDLPYRAILDELLRVGAVFMVDEKVIQSSNTYVPREDSVELLRISLQSVADLVSTIDFNDQNKPDNSLLQLTVQYDNVSFEGSAQFRDIGREKARDLIRELDTTLSTYDRDSNPNAGGVGTVRTGLGVFYFEDRGSDEDLPQN